MLLMLCISLYTSRLVLSQLGITDYGIYNVIGGLIMIFSYISGSMAQASQRFITFALGKDDNDELNRIFSTAVHLHVMLAVIVVLLGETIGLWYVCNVAVIPPSRFNAAMWVYQCSIIVACATIVAVPYNALIIAHEKMSAFAYFSIIEAFVKLGIVFALMLSPIDKLILYAILMAALSIVMRVAYGIYAAKEFPESEVRNKPDKESLKVMGSYAGWSLWGSLAAAGYTQGLNLLLNFFFNPAVNAARGVAVTVQAVIRNFSNNFQVAVNPQITKSYASSDFHYLHKLICRSSVFSFFLFFIIALPVFLEIDTLLKLWLVEVPQYSASFIRIMLCISAVELIATPLNVAIQSTGKIRGFEVSTSLILLAIVPLSYIGLKIYHDPNVVFFVYLFQVVLAMGVRVWIAKRKIGLPVSLYLRTTVLRIITVASISVIIPVCLHIFLYPGFLRLIIVSFGCITFTPGIVFLLGLDKSEQCLVIEKIKSLRKKIHHT